MITMRRRRRHYEDHPMTVHDAPSNVRVITPELTRSRWAELDQHAAQLAAELRDFRDYGRRLSGGAR